MILTDAAPAAALIRRARKKMNLSQPAFAEQIGVRRHTVIRWEQGHPVPKAVRMLVKRLIEECA